MNIHCRSHILSFVTLFLLASSAWADWSVVGASYKCTKSTFALYATVESSGGNIPAPPQTTSLTIGDNNITCNIGAAAVVARVNLSGPGRNGACGSPGTIGIWKMEVGGIDLVEFGEQMVYCNQQPSIISVEASEDSQGVSVSICRGIWKWGSRYENIQCDKKRVTQHGNIIDAKTP